MRIFFSLLFVFSYGFLSAQRDLEISAVNQKRIALVIGNGAYQHASPLTNTINDADAITSALKSVGFDVILVKNATNRVLEEKVREFTATIEAGKYPVALCFYAGHGLQVDGENFLVPIDANPQRQADVKWECLNAQRILDAMESARATTKIILLDACRNNPLPRAWGRSTGSNGLAYMNAPDGSFVGFATSPGTVAYDGGGNNSPYTTAILQNLQTPGISISDLFTRVNKTTQTLAAKEGKNQTPFFNSSLSDVFYFVPANQEPGKPPQVEVKVAAVNQSQQEKIDSDFDGFPDDSDDCPNDYGTLRGCPDSDRDGIADHLDKCPYEPGTATDKGCPVSDSDGDGVVDAVDKCPDKKGAKEWQGCPDSDGDGVPDHRDECWDIAGDLSNNGCPFTPRVAIINRGDLWFSLVEGDTVRLRKSVRFTGEILEPTVVLEDFMISTTEITQGFWKKIMGSNPSFFNDCDQCPVEQVSWDEIQVFLQKLNEGKKNNYVYRLPTQAEWEYAARGGKYDTGQIYSGSNDIEAVGWHQTNADNKTHPVESKEPNILHIFDMTGNVEEWCSDSVPLPDTVIKVDTYYVLRGGSWNGDKTDCRIVSQNIELPNYKASNAGFRIACTTYKSKQ